MDEKGYSWPEAVLTLTIIVVIFSTLLPLATKMTTTLHNKKIAMHAAETAYKGTIAYHAYGVREGEQSIEGIQFNWIVHGHSICVSYSPSTEVVTTCVDY